MYKQSYPVHLRCTLHSCNRHALKVQTFIRFNYHKTVKNLSKLIYFYFKIYGFKYVVTIEQNITPPLR